MNPIKQNDILIGNMNEELIQLIYKEKFNLDLIKTDENHPMDFDDGNNYYEVKSRNFNHDRYDTTMVGLNKILFSKNCIKPCYFLFAFKDGIYSYKYNKNDRFEVKLAGRKDRGLNEMKKYVFIPIDRLTKID